MLTALQCDAMPGHVAIVTDSTACIPAELAARAGVRVVQHQLRIGERMDEESRFSSDEIVAALRGPEPVSTTPPDAGAFFWTYQDAIARGATAIVSVHLSGRMSKTCQVAKDAAADARVPVHVLDSGTVGMSLGFAVLAAARVTQAGGDLPQALAIADIRISRSTELFYVETLEYLRRGGRLGATEHRFGGTLALKSMLTVRGGEIAPLDRTVGTERALRKLVDRAVSVSGGRPVDIAVEHIGDDKRVSGILESLRGRVPNLHVAMAVRITSSITAHTGPGALGITISPAV